MNPITKSMQTASRGRKPRKASSAQDIGPVQADVAEVAIEAQAEGLLDALRIEWRRVPDSLWRFLKQSAPVWITVHMAKRWKHKPDLLLLLPIGGGYSLAKEIELKSAKGKLSPGQEEYAARMPVTVCRTPDQTIAVVGAAQLQAKRCTRCMAGGTYQVSHQYPAPGQPDTHPLAQIYERGNSAK